MKALETAKFLLVLILLLGSGTLYDLQAQNMYELRGKPVLTVMGGSTLHDWEMSSAQSTGKAVMIIENASLKNVRSATITMKAESLKSGKAKMDEIAYESLKTKKHADIVFVLTSFRNLDNKRAIATGKLTIAGTTKPVTFNIESTVKGEAVLINGETNIKFTDFNITPPTALLGTVKTTNDLKLIFRVSFQAPAIQI